MMSHCTADFASLWWPVKKSRFFCSFEFLLWRPCVPITLKGSIVIDMRHGEFWSSVSLYLLLIHAEDKRGTVILCIHSCLEAHSECPLHMPVTLVLRAACIHLSGGNHRVSLDLSEILNKKGVLGRWLSSIQDILLFLKFIWGTPYNHIITLFLSSRQTSHIPLLALFQTHGLYFFY